MNADAIYDCHVHFGQFRDVNLSFKELVKIIEKVGVSFWCGMPVFTNKSFVIKELVSDYRKLLKMSPNNFKPILAIDPEMVNLINEKNELDEIPFVAAKIHPFIHHWLPFSEKFQRVLGFVREKNIPLMIHTGGRALSDAGMFNKVCKVNKNITFILCHARPLNEALKILDRCENTLVDTAFLEVEDLKVLISEGYVRRILFGSDVPVIVHYKPELLLEDWYRERVYEIEAHFGKEIFEVFNDNFLRVFNNMVKG